MRAIIHTKYGSPDVLQLKEVEKPVPKDNEVLVKIYAASVNSWDWDLLRGKPYLYRLLFGLFRPKIRIIGCDIAGKVEAVGKNVIRFKPGDEVFGDLSANSFGAFAEYVCANENAIIPKPGSMTFEQAAALPQAYVLAYQSLTDKRQIKQGDKILMIGAGGGVGTFVVQIAKSLGAEVTCVDSKEKLDLLRTLGADYVIDYQKDDFSQNGKLYDLIIDVVANRSVFTYRRSLLPDGIFVLIGGTIPTILKVAFLGSLISLVGSKKLSILAHHANKNLETVKELFEAGKVKPVIDKTFTFNEVPEALRYFGEGHFKGKIVIKVEHDN